jgi:hypothetical protein
MDSILRRSQCKQIAALHEFHFGGVGGVQCNKMQAGAGIFLVNDDGFRG